MAETEKYMRILTRNEGWLCLDFANTAEYHNSEKPIEQLQNYASLVNWAEKKGILTNQEAEALLAKAQLLPDRAESIYKQAIEVREAIFHIFSAITHQNQPKPTALLILNRALVKANSHFQITSLDKQFVWNWSTDQASLEVMLWPVVRSAANLLTSEDLARVGQCADDQGCGCLFLDTSRNRSRRWCSMEGCGNRSKARGHYQRRH